MTEKITKTSAPLTKNDEPMPVEIIGMVKASWVKVEEPEPGFLVQLQGEVTSMSTFMTDEAMVRLMEWVSSTLKEKLDRAVEAASEKVVN